MERPGCEHCQSIGEPSPRVINGHEYTLDQRERDHLHGGWVEWRWLCSCEGRGQWQSQSDSCAYHAWLKHMKKWR